MNWKFWKRDKNFTIREIEDVIRGKRLCLNQVNNIIHIIDKHHSESACRFSEDKMKEAIGLATVLMKSNIMDILKGNVEGGVYTNPDMFGCNCKRRNGIDEHDRNIRL